mmetsp:Transcript_19834/g.43376  ORF Transcript_19834/g.43376 Transcript_19834/m.43376 type:complete len:267 (+) Transcript_19834:161-961(+)
MSGASHPHIATLANHNVRGRERRRCSRALFLPPLQPSLLQLGGKLPAAHGVRQLPNTVHRNAHDVPLRQKPRRLEARPYPRGRARGQHVPGVERHRLRDDRNQLRNWEEHVRDWRVLPQLTVDPCPHPQRLCDIYVRGRYDPRAHGAEGVHALSQKPLLVLLLQVPCGDIVQNGVPEDVVHCVLARDTRPSLANDHRQLALIVQLVAHPLRILDAVLVANHRSGRLRENDGMLRGFNLTDPWEAAIHLLYVLRVVLPNTEDVSGRH